MKRLAFGAVVLIAGCQPNPRNEIAAVARAALAEAARKTPCVDRTISQWQPATTARRVDTTAPSGFDDLRADHAFRGGGALSGSRIAGVAIRGGAGCIDLRGPVIDGDRALIELHLAPVSRNAWLRKVDGNWRVVATTRSYYPD